MARLLSGLTFRKARLLLGLLLVGLFVVAPSSSVAEGKSRHATGECSDDTILVRFTRSAGSSVRVAKRFGFRAEKLKDFKSVVPGLEVWKLPKGMSLDEPLDALENDPDVMYAEVNHIHHAEQVLPNDPRFSQLWGLQNVGDLGGTPGADIHAPEAWGKATGSTDVVVGVVDTGIDWNHPDLAPNVWTNPGEIPGNGIDDDRNGVIDDVHGLNAVVDNGNPMDGHSHGTHVAGTIGAKGNNGVGVVGVNWNVKLMALKFLSDAGSGTTADAIQALNYAVMMKVRGVNVRVLNNSWGGGGFNQALLDAINSTATAGMLFVAAAGNDSTNNDVFPHFPSSYNAPNIVAVAASDRFDLLSSFSNHGTASVDLAAPGSSILSTVPGGTYRTFSGTSMATPHVSGAAALLLALNRDLTYAQLKSTLMNTVDQGPAFIGMTASGGRLNLARAAVAIGPPLPDFTLSVSAAKTILQGGTATYAVTTKALNGFTGGVSLSLASSPALAGATVTFTPSTVAGGGSSTLTIATAATTPWQSYQLTVNGTSGTLTRNIRTRLQVDPQQAVVQTFSNLQPLAIPSGMGCFEGFFFPVTSTITIPAASSKNLLSTNITVNSTFLSSADVFLTSPRGTSVRLPDTILRSSPSTESVPGFEGELTGGAWTLSICNVHADESATLTSWSLTIKGAANLIDPTPPVTDIDVERAGFGQIFLHATPTDNLKVTSVKFLANGVLLATDTTPPYSTLWDSGLGPNGTYTVTAVATDWAGKTGSASTSVAINHDTVTITKAQWKPGGFAQSKFQIEGKVSTPDAVIAIRYPDADFGFVEFVRAVGGTWKFTDIGIEFNPLKARAFSSGGGQVIGNVAGPCPCAVLP